MKILGVSGSLSKNSLNTAALRAAAQMLPEHEFVIADISDLPLVNPDLEQGGHYPQAVERFRAQVRDADALLIATPEYNASIPAPLKNAIDWGSRPQNVFAKKPVAIIGAALGALGTSRAQYPLRQTLGVLDTIMLGQPEVFIGSAEHKFKDGQLTDTATLEFLSKMLAIFVAFVQKVEM